MRWVYALIICLVLAYAAHILYDAAYVWPVKQAQAEQHAKELASSMNSSNCALEVKTAQLRGELADFASTCDSDSGYQVGFGSTYRTCRLYYVFPRHRVKIDPKDTDLLNALHHCAQPSDIDAGKDAWMADPDCVCPVKK